MKHKAIEFIDKMTTEVKPENPESIGSRALASTKTLGKLAGLKATSVASSVVGTVKDTAAISSTLVMGAPEVVRGLTKELRDKVENLHTEGQAVALTEAVETYEASKELIGKIKTKTAEVVGREEKSTNQSLAAETL